MSELKLKRSTFAHGIFDRLERAWLVGNPGRRVLLVGRVPARGGVLGVAVGPWIVVLVRVVSVAMIVAMTVAMIVGRSSRTCSGQSGSENLHLL